MYQNENNFIARSFSWNNVRIYLLTFVILFSTMWIWGYITLLRSDYYSSAEKYLGSNRQVGQSIGSIQSMRPGYVGFQAHINQVRSTARFQVHIRGDLKSAIAYIDMINNGNGWKVSDGKLMVEDGNIAILEPQN
jgi:hypothetical protein